LGFDLPSGCHNRSWTIVALRRRLLKRPHCNPPKRSSRWGQDWAFSRSVSGK
jgi:hypothetical protein